MKSKDTMKNGQPKFMKHHDKLNKSVGKTDENQ